MSSTRQAWARELDRLEADIARAELLATGEARDETWTAWQPPDLPGTIPGDLVARATGLLKRYAAALEALSRSMATVRAQRGFATKVSDIAPTAGERVPVYLDVSC